MSSTRLKRFTQSWHRVPSIVRAANCICANWRVQTLATGMSVNPNILGRVNGYELWVVLAVRPVRYKPDLIRDFFGRENEVDTAAFNCALRHIRLTGCIELLGDRYTTHIFDAT